MQIILNAHETDDSYYYSQFYMATPLVFVFQEQSYYSLHSARSLAWDHSGSDIDYPCGVIANFCGVIADPAALLRSLRRSAVADANRCTTC